MSLKFIQLFTKVSSYWNECQLRIAYIFFKTQVIKKINYILVFVKANKTSLVILYPNRLVEEH